MWRKKIQFGGKKDYIAAVSTTCRREECCSRAGDEDELPAEASGKHGSRRQGRDARERWPGGGGMRRKKDTGGWKAASAGVKEQQRGMREGAG